MSKVFTLNQLVEGIRDRNNTDEGRRLVEKWSRTGLLRGLDGVKRDNMARMLENQAAQVLRESSSLSTGGGNLASSGDIRGFTSIAFPIVRRVFGGLVANELVSIQPMSLPSGLLFYLDYTYGTNVGGDTGSDGTAGSLNAQTFTSGKSIYNNPTGKGIRSGSLATGGQYDLVGTSFTKVHKNNAFADSALFASGAFHTAAGADSATIVNSLAAFATGTDGKFLQFDPQLTNLIETNSTTAGATNGSNVFQFLVAKYNNTFFPNIDPTNAKSIALYGAGSVVASGKLGVVGESIQGGQNIVNVRRLTQVGTYVGGVFTPSPLTQPGDANAAVLLVVSGVHVPLNGTPAQTGLSASYAIAATLNVDSTDGSTLTIPSFESSFSTTAPTPLIPEIDIKIESIAVTATTRKLRARWSPELAQDLNAYHSMDAEVELTQILSEQIALEIDREILNDLLTEANGANYFWSRAPGRFLNKTTGAAVSLASALSIGPTFTGNVREWYETLTETIIDVANEIHRKTLRGSANFIVVSPDVATILEASVLYKPSYSLDGQGQVGSAFQIGATPIGSLSNRFTVYKDPYFPRNKILVGYKGGSYLETGYVYAPYVPLIVTPTIFAPEDFTPRKGVMTRYGKKMVRSDFYGTVTCLDMNII
jgi:hypothetical protein